MSDFKTIDDLDLRDKTILVRVDFNVPLNGGAVADSTRIDRTAPTLVEMAEKGGRVVVMSHLDRPNGKPDPAMSLGPVAAALSRSLGGRPIPFAEDCIGAPAEKVIGAMKAGDIVMLENLRFHPGEEANDPSFAQALARLGDIYVNDAFSCAHRCHTSTEGLAHLMPSAAGRLMVAELDALTDALERPKRPVAALVGGAKISTKLAVLGHLMKKVDLLIIGGAMGNTFLLAQGVAIGTSLAELEMTDQARAIMAGAAEANCEILLPVDAVVAKEFKAGTPTKVVPINAVPPDAMILDVGPETTAMLAARMAEISTLVWNGPLGAFEIPPFDTGTVAFARDVARLTETGKLLSVAGGGDTGAALAHAGVSDQLSYVSTAGGAFLEWLEGRVLPSVEVLRRNQ